LLLTSAELALLVSASGARSDAFIADTDLIGLPDQEADARLLAGRKSAIERGLSSSGPNGMLLLEPVKAQIRAVAQPKAGLQLMHARAKGSAVRTWIGRDANSGAWGVLTAIDPATFSLSGAVSEDAVTALIATQGGADMLPEDAPDAAVTLPAALLQNILESEESALATLPKALEKVGLAPDVAQLLSQAGLRPTMQSALTTLSADGKKLSARALLWFGDANSTWISETINDDGSVRLRRATRTLVTLAIRALVRNL
jgi:hypothetical protein